jgi:RNA recognition motif-containing protein
LGRGNQTFSKRAREAERDRKKRDKAERLRRNRERSEGGVPIASVEDIQVAAMSTPMPTIAADGTDVNATGGRVGGPPCRLFVGSLSWETTGEDLRTLFSTVGHVLDAAVVKDRATGHSRGFGFVTMDRKSAMLAVKELDGRDMHGRPIRVNVATERSR